MWIKLFDFFKFCIITIFIFQVQPGRNFVQIFSYTEFEWLDIVEIEFQPGQESGTLAKVSTNELKLLYMVYG